MTTHNTERLEALGAQRIALVAQLAALDEQLKPEIFAAAQADVPQVKIKGWTGMVRESIRLASMTPAEREAERAKRRKPADAS